jgi:hypothetical protein
VAEDRHGSRGHPGSRALDRQLDAWVDAGLMSEEQATAIRPFERRLDPRSG